MINKHLIDPMNFTIEEIDELFKLAHQIISNPNKFSNTCRGKILATLFYESSTRTKLSFESAMLKLGGNVIGFSDPNLSSVSKGETIADTIRIVSIYSDIIAMRHSKEGAAKLASISSRVPLINAGDGGHQHPTQTLTDLLTIESLKGRLNNHTIGICGDLKNGRTVHSLIKAISRYKDNKFILISPNKLRIPEYIKEEILKKNNIAFEEVENLESVINKLDILYMTRIQQERFSNKEEYLELKDIYILNREKLNQAKKDMIVMHPLPRVNEINIDVDTDKRAVYFKQAEFGMFVRMALIIKLLGLDTINNERIQESNNLCSNELTQHTQNAKNLVCQNKNCITQQENYAPKLFTNVDDNNKFVRCKYCDSKINLIE